MKNKEERNDSCMYRKTELDYFDYMASMTLLSRLPITPQYQLKDGEDWGAPKPLIPESLYVLFEPTIDEVKITYHSGHSVEITINRS